MAIDILEYGPTMLKSMLYSLTLMLLQIFTCSMVGYGFARFNFPFKGLLFGCVVVMIVIPTHTIMLPLYMTFKTFDPLGLCTLIFGKPLSFMGSSVPMYIMTALFCALFLGGLSTGIVILDIIIVIVLCTVVTFVTMTVPHAVCARFKVEQVFKFYWTVVAGLALISLILVWLGL